MFMMCACVGTFGCVRVQYFMAHLQLNWGMCVAAACIISHLLLLFCCCFLRFQYWKMVKFRTGHAEHIKRLICDLRLYFSQLLLLLSYVNEWVAVSTRHHPLNTNNFIILLLLCIPIEYVVANSCVSYDSVPASVSKCVQFTWNDENSYRFLHTNCKIAKFNASRAYFVTPWHKTVSMAESETKWIWTPGSQSFCVSGSDHHQRKLTTH